MPSIISLYQRDKQHWQVQFWRGGGTQDVGSGIFKMLCHPPPPPYGYMWCVCENVEYNFVPRNINIFAVCIKTKLE